MQLIRIERQNGEYVGVPRTGTASLLQNTQSRIKVFTLDATKEAFTQSLNTAMQGGTSYPILTAIMGTVAGAASGGAGLLFSAAMLGVDLGRRSTKVLARIGDEIWHVEEIGKSFEDNTFSADRYIPIHVSSYFLVDPYRSRGQSTVKGWLLHEERKRVVLN